MIGPARGAGVAAAAGAASEPPSLPEGWRLLVHESLPSTSAALRTMAVAGAAGRLAILARRQTAGIGRQGRAWQSPAGNLALSVLLRPAAPAGDVGQWALLAGVALAEAAAARAADDRALRLKWPNDLMVGGAKAAGILAEAQLAAGAADQPPRLAWLILGIGANLRVAPPLPDRPTAVLPVADTPEVFAGHVLHALECWLRVQAAEGFAPIRAAWLRRGPAIGEAIGVRLGTTLSQGRFAGLADDGGLLLDSPEGRRHILAGEVTAPDRAAAAPGPDAVGSG